MARRDEGGSMSDAVGEAAARLEQAVERLATAMARPRAPEGVPPERLAELSGRLDATLQRLRTALMEIESAESDDAAGPEDDPEAAGDPLPGTPAETGPAAQPGVHDSNKGS
jgi:hypothetical protein